MGYAFISYSSRQQKDADALRQLLHTNEIRTWMAPYDIPAGEDYADVVNDAIQNAACIVLLLTKDSQKSTFVDKEIERALHYGKTIAPIQLDDATLNDSFSFYLCNQQIITVPTIDASVPKIEKLLQHLQFLCNDRLPEKETAPDAARDKRVRRQKIARLFLGFGAIFWGVSLLCGQKYIWYATRGTYGEMYGTKPIPPLPQIAWTYVLFFSMALVAILVFLYGYGLRDPQKKTWRPREVFPKKLLLPAFSVLCATGSFMLRFIQDAAASIIRGLGGDWRPVEGYTLPQWVTPATRLLTIACIVTAVISLALALAREKKNGFSNIKALPGKFRIIIAHWKRGGK